jgi:hypothetical protein
LASKETLDKLKWALNVKKNVKGAQWVTSPLSPPPAIP